MNEEPLNPPAEPSREEKAKAFVAQVEQLRQSENLNVEKACKKLGFHFSHYYNSKYLIQAPPKAKGMLEDLKTKLAKVEELRATGTPVQVACLQVGLGYSHYYQLRAKLNAPPVPPKPTSVPGIFARVNAKPQQVKGRWEVGCPECSAYYTAHNVKILGQTLDRHWKQKHVTAHPQRPVERQFTESFFCPNCRQNQAGVIKAYDNGVPNFCVRCGYDLTPAFKALQAE